VRPDIARAIDGERDYQDEKWNGETTATEGRHTVTEFLVYMRDYVEEALHHASRNADPAAVDFTLHSVRKVTALGVACMEQNGVRYR
jgi:hypothetical protein